METNEVHTGVPIGKESERADTAEPRPTEGPQIQWPPADDGEEDAGA